MSLFFPKSRIFLQILSFFIPLYATSQDAVYLLNGRTLEGRITTADKSYVDIVIPWDGGKEIIKKIPEKKIWYIKKSGEDQYPFPRIQMMNGTIKRLEATRYDSVLVWYKNPVRPESKEKFFRERYVFSYFLNGKQEIVFTPMITDLDTIEVQEAYSAFLGKRAARTRYRQPYTALISAVVGLGSGAMLAWYGLLPVAGYASVDAAINPRVGNYRIRRFGEALRDNDYFRYGFNKQAKLIKLRNNVLGGVIGMAAGLGAIRYLRSKDN